MATQRRGHGHGSKKIHTQYTTAIPYFGVVILSIMYISSAFALSLNPSDRYLKEMGRLLRNDDRQVIATPLETVGNSGWDNYSGSQEDYGWPQHQTLSSDQIFDTTTSHGFDESRAVELGRRFDTPQPPKDPYDRRERALFDETLHPQLHEEELYQQPPKMNFSNEANEPQVYHQTNEPQRFTNLLDVVNEQIAALGHQIQKSSNSLRSVIDKKFPQPEMEWKYDNQEGYSQIIEGYSTPTQQSEFELAEEYDLPYDLGHYDETTAEYFQVNDQIFYDQIPGATLEHQHSCLEQENYGDEQVAVTNDLEQADENITEEDYTEQERQRLVREQLEQEYINRLRVEVARAKELRQQKDNIHKESQKKRQTEAANGQSVSIMKSRVIPQLPETNDPLELLGLDYHNPPENLNDIRRAFLKMAKRYHPDAMAADATPEERERASINFARVNSAYQILKDKQERLGDDYFATMLGGPMYEPRNSHFRQSFSKGYGDDDYSSIFSGNSYSARYGPKHGGQPRPQNENNRDYSYGTTKFPFRRNRHDVGDNCHVSGKEFPPFFNN